MNGARAPGRHPPVRAPGPPGSGGALPRPFGHVGRVLLLALLVFGLFVGWVAQMLLGLGTRPDGRTLVAGLVGSFVGGLLASLVAGDGLSLRPSGLIGSLVGAIIVLLVWTRLAPAPASGRGGRR